MRGRSLRGRVRQKLLSQVWNHSGHCGGPSAGLLPQLITDSWGLKVVLAELALRMHCVSQGVQAACCLV